jgi:hypothetical protein
MPAYSEKQAGIFLRNFIAYFSSKRFLPCAKLQIVYFEERTVWLSFINGNFGLVSPDEPEYDHNTSESDGKNSRRCRLHGPRPDQ